MKEIRARLHLSDEVQAYLEQQSRLHRRSMNDEIVTILEQHMKQNRLCIISVALPPEREEKRARVDYLKTMFSFVQESKQAEMHAPEALCASPKNLSYDEAFVLLERKFFEVGWVYADKTPFLG